MAVTPNMSVGKVVVAAVAAVAAGVTFASYALPFGAYAGLQGLIYPGWPGILAYGLPVLLLALTVPTLAVRVSGWWIAAAGLASQAVVDLVPALTGAGADGSARSPAVILLAVAGGGLAAGGTLLAVAQLPRPGRLAVGIAFVAGVLLQPATLASDPDRFAASGFNLVLWLSLATVTLAALLTADGDFTVPGRQPAPRRGLPVLVAAVALAGVPAHAWLFGRGPADEAELFAPIASPARWYLVGLAALGAAALTGYAWHAWRATGVRWVVSAFVIGPMTLFVFSAFPSGRYQAIGLLVPAVLVALAVAAAVAVTRYADRLLPWDAVALVAVAVAFPLVPEIFGAGAETITHVLLLLLCFGLVWAVGFVRVTMRPDPVTRPVAGLLALGTAALLLGAQLLVPLLVVDLWDGPSRPWWVSALTGGAALVVALLFLADRAAARRRGSGDEAVPAEGPVDPKTTPESPTGPVTIEIER